MNLIIIYFIIYYYVIYINTISEYKKYLIIILYKLYNRYLRIN